MCSDADDEALLAQQIVYYRVRAAEYDATAYGDLDVATARVDRIVDGFGPLGDVLEIACGTGMWTWALAKHATSVLAIDTAPEAIAIARTRIDAAAVSPVDFELADVFAWSPRRRYDTVFFSAWLSHVPLSKYVEFWSRVAEWLAPDGRVLFIDEPVDTSEKEVFVDDARTVVIRELADGSTHRVVKLFIDPDELGRRLDELGWTVETRRDGADWLVSSARRR